MSRLYQQVPDSVGMMTSTVIWDVMPCSLAVGDQCSSETLDNLYETTWHHIPEAVININGNENTMNA
jgi:hypothetical protein